MKRYILLCIGLLCAGAAQAQIQLRIDQQALSNIDGNTYHLNDSTPTGLTATVTLSNNTNADFNDSLSFGYAIGNGGLFNVYNTRSYVGSGISADGPLAVHIPAGTSFSYQALVFHITSPVFVIGPTTVVIWPTLYHSGSSIGDSVRANIIIDNPSGITPVADAAFKVFIAGGELVVRNRDNSFGGIRIYDEMGRGVLAREIQGDNRIPMSNYPDGIYTIETTSKHGTRCLYRVLKQ